MKIKLLAALLVTGVMATNSYAIPPYPLNIANSERSTGETQLVCKDINALSEEEIDALNANPEKILSVDLELREICFE